MNRGKLIVLEGPDATGKTTQARRLVATLDAKGIAAEYLREPGGTDTGEEIRNILKHWTLTGFERLLLFNAARSVLLRTKVVPLLQKGVHVVLDRYFLSTLVYQSVEGIDRNLLDAVVYNAIEVADYGPVMPDLLFLCTASPHTIAQRLQAQGFDSDEAHLDHAALVAAYNKEWRRLKGTFMVHVQTETFSLAAAEYLIATQTLKFLEYYE